MICLSPLSLGPSDMRLVYDGLRLPPASVIWIWSLASLIFRAADGVTLTLTLGRLCTLGPLPASKYSINNDVCDCCDLLNGGRARAFSSLSARFLVVMVTGLPSSGIETEVWSVRRETSVAMSVGVASPPDGCSVEDSVGAGSGGRFVSTPISTHTPNIYLGIQCTGFISMSCAGD